jgi:hypothetical protein
MTVGNSISRSLMLPICLLFAPFTWNHGESTWRLKVMSTKSQNTKRLKAAIERAFEHDEAEEDGNPIGKFVLWMLVLAALLPSLGTCMIHTGG